MAVKFNVKRLLIVALLLVVSSVVLFQNDPISVLAEIKKISNQNQKSGSYPESSNPLMTEELPAHSHKNNVFNQLQQPNKPTNKTLPVSSTSSSLASVNRPDAVYNKVIMIGFDDGWKSQIQYAKPILDKYGFKASFFIVCNYANSGDPTRLNWQDIAILQHDHMDIECHTMDHIPLDKMSKSHLIYEIGGSKQCLATHGINSTIFAYPFNLGSKKPSVVDKVSHYYDFARTGTYPLMFLNCNGFVNIKPQQTDCRTHLPNGKLTFANRYDIRSDSFFHISSDHNYSPAEMFQRFIQQVNSQIPYNTNGKINAIPILIISSPIICKITLVRLPLLPFHYLIKK